MRSDYLNENSSLANGYVKKLLKVTENYTVTESDGGAILLVNPTATTEIDLPTVGDMPPGWNISIVLTEDTFSTDQGMGQKVNIDFNSGGSINGQTWGSDGDAGDVTATGDDYIACTASCTGGDRFDIFTDGVIWYVHGWVQDASECPFATAAG